jgi:acetylornithine/LysW-gamma-L-lysine aminotransferase
MSVRLEDLHGLPLYAKRDLTLVRGQNARVWDDRGRSYIDCVGGHGSANVGHCNPAVVEAVQRQAGRLITCSNACYNDVRGAFMARLASLSPPGLDRVYLCNSGAEAVESALKLARLSPGRNKVVAAFQAFHGRTMGALSATHNPFYRQGFGPLVEGFSFVPYNDLQALAAAVTEETAAVILEVVQGEGGVNVARWDYLHGAEALCRERGARFILDEVQTGFCRTGKMFALEHYGLTPDLVCLAKSIAGGLPMGALLCPSSLAVPPGKHGTTFGGNPLSCAAGLAALEFMGRARLAEESGRKGRWLMERLRAIPARRIREVRGLGLMIGIELREKAKPYLDALAEEGVLALPAGPLVIRLLPPLTIGDDDLEMVADALERVLSAPGRLEPAGGHEIQETARTSERK